MTWSIVVVDHNFLYPHFGRWLPEKSNKNTRQKNFADSLKFPLLVWYPEAPDLLVFLKIGDFLNIRNVENLDVENQGKNSHGFFHDSVL